MLAVLVNEPERDAFADGHSAAGVRLVSSVNVLVLQRAKSLHLHPHDVAGVSRVISAEAWPARGNRLARAPCPLVAALPLDLAVQPLDIDNRC